MSLSFNTWIILITHVLLYGVIYADITSFPGVHRRGQGGQAALTWGVTSLTSATDSIKIYRTDPDEPNNLVVQSVYGTVFYGSGYNSVKSPIVINEGSDTVTVTITSITTNDADQYFLNYQSLGQPLQRNGNAFIYVYGKPTKPILSQEPVTVIENQDVTVMCRASHTSVPTSLQQPLQFSWYLDGTDITSSPPARHSINNYTLTVTGVLRTDTANRYSCLAHEADGLSSDDSNQLQLNVKYGPYEISLMPQGPVTYNETSEVRVTCISDCNPPCDLRWTRANDVNFLKTTAELMIASVSRQDDDLYTCEAIKHGVQRSRNIDITVNFASEIADFTQSGTDSDIRQGSEITLTCTVNSRPGSTIEIIDIEHGEDLPICVQCFSLSHTFSNIQVTDSSNYTCKAANILGPYPKARQLLEIDVKGAYETCNSPQAVVGRPLNSNITVEICLTANPLDVISETDWSFVPDNGTKTDNNLPRGVKVVTESTNHQYKKLTKLVIDDILLLHYGRYTLSKANNYGGEQVSFGLVPQGPPEAPYDFLVTRTTAVSIYINWKVGFDGGLDQTFWLQITGPQGTFNKNIPGTGYMKGDLVRYTLVESDGLDPDTQYSLLIGARNNKGSVAGQTISTSTRARPVFTDNKPTIELQTDHALVTWPISNLDLLTHILAEVCVSADCQTTNITDPLVQPYTVLLPQTISQQYTFSFTFYDGEDVVNQQQTDLDISGSGLSIGAVAGGVIGAVVVVGAVVAVIVLWRRGIFLVPDKKRPKKQSSTAATQIPIVHYENVDGNSPVYHEVTESNMDISTYQGLHNPVSEMATSTYEELAVSNVKVFPASSSTVIGIFNESSVFRVALAKPSKAQAKSLPKKIVIKSVVDMVNYPNHYKYLQSAAEVMVKLVNCDNVIHCLGLTTGSI